jgi:hypothetical protein
MTYPLPPDPARFSALLAPPRMHGLAVCLRDTTALSPPLELVAAMIVRLAQGMFSQAAFPEAVLTPGRRWSPRSGTVADPAPCLEPTPHVQRSPASDGAAEPQPAGPLPMAAATPPAQRQQPAIAPAEPTGPGPARVAATPHVQRSPAGDGAAEPEPAGPLPTAAATPHAQRRRPDISTTRTASAARHTALITATPHVQRRQSDTATTRTASAAHHTPITATPHVQRPTPAQPPAAPTQPLACDAPPPSAPARQHPMPSGSRGRLKNGAPGGDYLAAPRCGARTRAGGSCRQPAMANGRCRLHGGKSTGARTEAGRDRLRSIHTKHGGYGRDSLAWFRRVDAFIAETKQMIAPRRRTAAVEAAAPPSSGTALRGVGQRDIVPPIGILRRT